ncbi:MAG: MBOAT family protein [Tissierellales bacterium]|nr:MBOAT family protein [Tissierellales bacterium]MBN2828138.1 MBOAT family protein [Tissierellales bacterium]
MLFHSFEFMLLLSVAVLLYFAIPRARIYVLAGANVIFYGASGIQYLLLFMFVAWCSYYFSKVFYESKKSLYFYIPLALNIFNLLFFKYTGFVLKNINTFFNFQFVWQDSLLAKIILPVGISFYTFQLIAYLVDVKKGDIEPEKSLVNFWVFISFFGQLIAGPIMRGQQFLPQISEVRMIKWSETKFKYGMYYIFMGLTKKVIFADYLADAANRYFSSYQNFTTLDGWIAAYLFGFQIYFDFSAYSEIAVGVGHLFGLDLDLNFKTPYISQNPKEFWKRWHITLSSWIRDYIYIPLGGNKYGFMKKCIFLLIAMSLSGLWHGAAWPFVIWGIFHGLLVVGHNVYLHYFSEFREKIKGLALYQWACIFLMFHLTTIGWIFFRAGSLSTAIFIIKRMLNPTYLIIGSMQIKYLFVIFVLYLIHIVEYYVRANEILIARFIQDRIPVPIRAFGYVSLIVILTLMTQSEQNTFIYFQF